MTIDLCAQASFKFCVQELSCCRRSWPRPAPSCPLGFQISSRHSKTRLVAAIFKGNCLKGSYCAPEITARDLSSGLQPVDLFIACLGAFLAHCGLHLLLLRLFVPLFGKAKSFYRKDARLGELSDALSNALQVARSYRDVASTEPCSWFSANPIHCLRSKYAGALSIGSVP